MTKITLYGFLLCPYVHRVRFALESLGLEYDYKEIDLFKLKQKEEAYLTINPFGKVPSIGINNENLCDSLPLLEFIENQFGGIFPEDNVRKTQQRIWAAYFDTNVIGKMWAILDLIKSKDVPAAQKLANKLAESIRFFTQHSGLSQKIQQNPKSFFEGDSLTYADFAIVPHFRLLENIYLHLFDAPIFDQIENQDQYILDFKTYFYNVSNTEIYKRITVDLKTLPPQGRNSLLDSFNFTPETFDYISLWKLFMSKKFLEV